MLRNINQPKLCNGTRLSVKKLMTNITEAKILTGPFKGEDVLTPRISMSTDMSCQLRDCNSQFDWHLQSRSTKHGTIFRIVWVIFTHWLLLTWAIICCLFQSWQSRQSLYLHRKWNYQKYCVSTSIGKLNILETCIFFFFPHLNKLSHSNAWPGTASICMYIYELNAFC